MNIGIIHNILERFTKYSNDSQSVGIFLKILESFTKYWNSLGVSPKTSNLTVMHLKPFKSRFQKKLLERIILRTHSYF